jgi:TetR/AcrR family acrAB operon transcriptional repressor
MSETTYNKILIAAAECFSKNGFNGTTMDQIAKKARVSKGALYWHFKNKEELFVKLKEQHITQVLQTLEKLFASTETFDSKLAKSFELCFSALTPRQRKKARLNMEFWAAAPKISGLSEMLNNQYNRLQAFLKTTINEAVTKGELRKEIDSESLSAILLATLDGLELHWAILEKNFDWQKIHATLCEIILKGLKTQKGSRHK